MRALAVCLSEMGSAVVLASLSGHRGNVNEFAAVTREIWLKDIAEAYTFARAQQTEPDIPLYFVGYSLGALVNLNLISRQPEQIRYDKMILLAPAIALKWPANLLKPLFGIGDQWRLPSFTPARYQANRQTPVRAYQVLFALVQSLRQSGYAHLHIPSLVYIDPRDELVSIAGLQNIVNRFNLTDWQVLEMRTQPFGQGPHYRHLIIDEPTLGSANWSRLNVRIKEFFEL
jgi:esterase/lipase